MKKCMTIIIFLTVISACNREKTIVNPGPRESITLKSGASFGECIGYCRREVIISDGNVTFTRSGWLSGDDAYPPIVITDEITLQAWNPIIQLIDRETLENMNDVYGCPDCVDQGAEWIEIIRPDFSKKITFEFGDSLATIQDLLDQLRSIRLIYEDRSSG